MVLATVGSSSKSELDFWDLDFNSYGLDPTTQATKEEWGTGVQLLGNADHYGVTDVEWDPSGRYLATSASVWTHAVISSCVTVFIHLILDSQLENGYAIWDFRGQELEKHVLDRFKQIIWRPRPRTLLSKEQQRVVKKNLREYSKQFEEEDAQTELQGNAEQLASRKRLVDEWNAWRSRCKKELADEGADESEEEEDDSEEEEVELMVEEIIEQIEEEVVD